MSRWTTGASRGPCRTLWSERRADSFPKDNMNNHALVAALAVFLALPAHAQKGKAGAYGGTFEVSGSERDPKVSYKATVKVNLPITKRNESGIEADYLGGDAPPATIKVTQYDYFHREKSA